MAHIRTRQCKEAFQKTMAFSSIVGIFGHRQVGKTTFCESVVSEHFTLDKKATRQSIARDAETFLNNIHKKPACIDECQIEPDLFPALKEYVRTHKAPGQFILTGSVRFTSRKAIRESLTGRLLTIELFPLIISELQNKPLPEILPLLIKSTSFSETTLTQFPSHKIAKENNAIIEKYLTHGGLPRICFSREQKHRDGIMKDLHNLILDRDLRLILETRLSLETIRNFLERIAENGWNPWNASIIKRELGLAHATQNGLLYALESIFLIRRIPLKERTGYILILEDQYEEFLLSKGKHPRDEQLLSAFYRNARAQFGYRFGEIATFSSYWTADGARVPLVIETSTGKLGIHIVTTDSPSLTQIRSTDSFLRKHRNAKVAYAFEKSITPAILDERCIQASIGALL